MPSIFVTGAGKGIGRAIVARFAAAGWDVAGVTRTPADVDCLNRLESVRATLTFLQNLPMCTELSAGSSIAE